MNPQYNTDFIGSILCSADFIRYIRKYEEGTVYERQAVKSSDFLRGVIWVPDTKEEQDQIASIISEINNKGYGKMALLLGIENMKKQHVIKEMYRKQSLNIKTTGCDSNNFVQITTGVHMSSGTKKR